MTSREFLRELLRERFGPVPTAELHRPPARDFGRGGPDSPEAGAFRLYVLEQAFKAEVA